MRRIGAGAVLLAIAVCVSDGAVGARDRFELVFTSQPIKLGDGRIEIGLIEASRPDDPSQVQKIPVVMNRSGNWTFQGLTMEDITFDGYLDIATIAASVSEPAIRPPHRFELIVAEEPNYLGDETFQVGWIKASLPDDPSHVQKIPVLLGTDYWTFQELKMQDINFDGWLDIAVVEHGGAKWGVWYWWIYNPQTQQFDTTDLTRELSRIRCSYRFETDPKTQRITLMVPNSVNHNELTFQVVNGQLVFCGSRWHWYKGEERVREEFHTPPDRWNEPRIYHSPLTLEYDNKIDMGMYGRYPEETQSANAKEKIFSSNGGYWLHLDENVQAQTELRIYKERDCIYIHVNDTDHRYRANAKWINEKLVYFQWWWGRVLGGYLIFDVESKQILQKEFVHDGHIAYQQFQEAKREGWLDAGND